MTFAPRSKARVSRAGDPLAFRTRLEAAFAADPSLTIVDAMARTGASRKATETVKRRLVAAGKLPFNHRHKERVW